MSPLGPPQHPDEIGRVGRYRVLRELGRGGMGVVYIAEDTNLRRKVAVKCLLPEVASRPGNRERFEREAWATAAVEHENVVAIHDVGQEKGLPYLVMPLLRGETLGDRLKRDYRLPLPEVVRVGREMARGLAALHAAGLVHRDVKPGNVWLEAGSGRVKLLDFGLARPDDGTDAVSLSGQVMGTPGYMAPEQVTGDPLDHRADLFSLGCILYETATGRPAFEGPNVLALLANLALQAPAPPESINPDLPPELSSLILSLIEKQPDRRPPSALIVIDHLDRISPSGTAPVSLTPPTPIRRPLGDATPSAETVPSGVRFRPGGGPPTEPDPAPAPAEERRVPKGVWVTAGVTVAALAVGGILLVVTGNNGKQVLNPDPPPIPQNGKYDQTPLIPPHLEEISPPRELTPQVIAERQYRDAVLLLYGVDGVTPDRAQAVAWLHQSAKQDHAPAQAVLGDLIARQGERPELNAEARGWFDKALPALSRGAAEGDTEAQYALGLLHRSHASVAYNPAEAVKWLGQAARAGHADAQFRLGRAYDYAVGVSYDPVEAVRWYTAAADRRHVLAAGSLGRLQCEGWGMPRDEAKGLARLREVSSDVRRLAEAGDPDAEVLLGAMASEGRGVKQDDAEAARWFIRAAERGDPVAANRLAGCYAEGLGVTQDQKEAARLYRAAADKAVVVAQYNLGHAYSQGTGVEQDLSATARWFDRAAEAGLPHAQLSLGQLYTQGRGVPKNEEVAKQWYSKAAAGYRRAAGAGDVGAQFRLGQLYQRGLGVPEDPKAAREWYRKAAEQGHDGAKKALERLK
jgi:TPR repeat protein/serine/threonine protein kinase